MASLVLDEVTCPICLETLQPPIRILACGHNLCQDCLAQLCGASSFDKRGLRKIYIFESCPTCRKEIRFGVDGFESLPRNRTLEHVIVQLALNENKVDKKQQKPNKMTVEELKQMQELAQNFMVKQNFTEAASLIRMMKEASDGYDKIPLMIDLAKCFIKTNQLQRGMSECDVITAMVSADDVDSKSQSTLKECDLKMRELGILLIENAECEAAVALIRCCVKIVERSFSGKERIVKLGESAIQIKNAAQTMQKLNRVGWFQRHVKLMEGIIDKIAEVEDADPGFKCEHVVRSLSAMAVCFHQEKDYLRSLDIYKEGIRHIKFVFGKSASLFRMYGGYHNDLGMLYEITEQFEEAERAYRDALVIYSKVTDWESKDGKEVKIFSTTKNLQRVQHRLIA